MNKISISSVLKNILGQAHFTYLMFGSIGPSLINYKGKYAFALQGDLSAQIGFAIPYYGSLTVGTTTELIGAAVPVKVQDVRLKAEALEKMTNLSALGAFNGDSFEIKAKKESAEAFYKNTPPKLTLKHKWRSTFKQINKDVADDKSTALHGVFKTFSSSCTPETSTFGVLVSGTEQQVSGWLESGGFQGLKTQVESEGNANKLFHANLFTGDDLGNVQWLASKVHIIRRKATNSDDENSYPEELDDYHTRMNRLNDRIDAQVKAVNASGKEEHPSSYRDVNFERMTGVKCLDAASLKAELVKLQAWEELSDHELVEGNQLEEFAKYKSKDYSTHEEWYNDHKSRLGKKDESKSKDADSQSKANDKNRVSYRVEGLCPTHLTKAAQHEYQTAVMDFFSKNQDLEVETKADSLSFANDNLADFDGTLAGIQPRSISPEATLRGFDGNSFAVQTQENVTALSRPIYELTAVDVRRYTFLLTLYQGITINMFVNLPVFGIFDGFGLHGHISLEGFIKDSIKRWTYYNIYANHKQERCTLKRDLATGKAQVAQITSNTFKSKYEEVLKKDAANKRSIEALQDSDYSYCSDIERSWSRVQEISQKSNKIGLSLFLTALNGNAILIQFTTSAINKHSDAMFIRVAYLKSMVGNPLADDRVSIEVDAELDFYDKVEIEASVTLI